MIYIIPTKRGLGAEFWGTHEDLTHFYELIGKLWNNDSSLNLTGSENRDKLISSFSYELRKAQEGSRLKRQTNHFSFEETEYLGCQISWVHFIFSLAALKYCIRFKGTSKLDLAFILQVEFWLEHAMQSYDAVGAKYLVGFIDDGIYGANEYIYHYMRSINLDYFHMGGGKRAFRKLPDLLRRGVFFTDEYKAYLEFLKKDSDRLGCDINEMEINDDDVDYDGIRW